MSHDDLLEDDDCPRLHAISASAVAPTRVEWLWPCRIPARKLTILDGPPGIAKSTFTADLAARVSRGAGMPDASGFEASGRAVLLIGYEDDAADTVVPRLQAAGADLENIYLADAITGGGRRRLVTLPDDGDALARFVLEHDVALVVIDPVMAALSSQVRTGDDHAVREALAPLKTIAELGPSVLIVRHLNKRSGETDPQLRGGGSIAFIGLARAGLMIGRDPEDPARRILATTKMNLAPEPPQSLAFEVRTNPEFGVGVVNWLGPTTTDARAMLEAAREGEEDRGALGEAVGVLAELLKPGAKPAQECRRDLADFGISKRTAERAKSKLGVRSFRMTNGKASPSWYWELPDAVARGAAGDEAVEW